MSGIMGCISSSVGSDGALRRVRFAIVESPVSDVGVLDVPEMLTSGGLVTSTLLLRCGLPADFSNESAVKK